MQSKSPLKRGARWPWISAAATALGGVAASLFLWQTLAQNERAAVEEDFRLEAGALQQRIEQETGLFMTVLDSIRYLHSLSDRISQEDFSEFVEKGMLYQQSVLGGFGFAQRIPGALRPALEDAAPDSGRPSLRLLERDGAGGFRSAAERPAYFPLTYQTPGNALGVPVGFDFASQEPERIAIEEMMSIGGPAMGSRTAEGEEEGLSAVYMYAPIYYSQTNEYAGAPPVFLMGFAAALFKPKELIDGAIAGVQGVRVRLIDPGDAASPPASALIRNPAPGIAYALEAPFKVANRIWLFRCEANENYVRAHATRRPEILLAAGLVITAFLSSQLLLMAGRARRIEKVVQARTADLREANQKLESEMAERLRLESEILEISAREQQRVGRDLHDSLGQKLSGAVYLSRALMEKTGQAPEEDRAGAEKINQILKESVAQVRRIARGLAPVDLSQEGLADALRRLADESREICGTPCEVIIKGGDLPLNGTAAGHLYHIAQEAVNNAVRHGKAAEIIIELALAPDGGTLSIADDGVGLPADAGQKGGMGLKIMRYRAAIIGGSLEILHRPGGGAEVKCAFTTKAAG